MAQLPRRKNCFCPVARALTDHHHDCDKQYLREIERWLQDRVLLDRVEYARLTSQKGEGMKL
jgi:hypothetical protein